MASLVMEIASFTPSLIFNFKLSEFRPERFTESELTLPGLEVSELRFTELRAERFTESEFNAERWVLSALIWAGFNLERFAVSEKPLVSICDIKGTQKKSNRIITKIHRCERNLNLKQPVFIYFSSD